MNRIRNIFEKPIIGYALIATLGLTACSSHPASSAAPSEQVIEGPQNSPKTFVTYYPNGTRNIEHVPARNNTNIGASAVDQWCDGNILYSETISYGSFSDMNSSSFMLTANYACENDSRLTPDDFPQETAEFGFIVKIVK